MHQPLPYNPTYTEPYGGVQSQQYPESIPGFSPSTLYDDFNSSTDFNSDSAGTPISHYSPALSATSFNLSLPTFGDDFFQFDPSKFERSSEPEECFKPEPYDGSIISTLPPRPLPASPAINPVELSLQGPTTAQDLTFNLEGINTDAPLFQSQVMGVALPSQRPIPVPLLVQQQPQPQQQQPIELAEDVKRYPPRTNLKRKSSCAPSSNEEEHRPVKRSSPSPPPGSSHSPPTRKDKDASPSTSAPKKTAHNMIEKRYRTNLNDKISALRDSVPTLRLAAIRQENGNYDEGIEGEEGDYNSLIPAPKLNKATILSKATEYIGQLERKCRALDTENRALRARMGGLEMLLVRNGIVGPPEPCVWN